MQITSSYSKQTNFFQYLHYFLAELFLCSIFIVIFIIAELF